MPHIRAGAFPCAACSAPSLQAVYLQPPMVGAAGRSVGVGTSQLSELPHNPRRPRRPIDSFAPRVIDSDGSWIVTGQMSPSRG